MQSNPTLSTAGVWNPLPTGATPPGYDPLANTFDALIPLGANGEYGIVVTGWSFPSNPGATPQQVPIAILGPQGNGTLTLDTSNYISDPSTNGAGSVIVADFNGDGKPDIVLLAHNEDPFVAEPGTAYMSNASGGYDKVTLPGLTMAHDAELTSINGQLAITTATFTPGDKNPIFTYTNGAWVEHFSTSVENLIGQSERVAQFGANGAYELVRGDDELDFNSSNVPTDADIAVYGFDPTTLGLTDTSPNPQPVQKITPYLSTLPQYANNVSILGTGLTHTYRLWTDDLNHDGKPDILAGESMFSNSNDTFPTALQVLINKGDGTFQDKTTALNPSMSLDMDELDYNPQFVDLDHSGINSYLFASAAQSASRQSNYLLLNDGTGHLYVALHDQFQALNTSVQNYVTANYTSANGYYINTAQFAKFEGVPQADGSVNYVAMYSISHANPDGSYADQYVFVNVPLDYNPTTDFTQNVTVSDRNGSTLIRTWAGNDVFHDTDAGPTTHIDGGLGANTSVYTGAIADYTISADSTGVHVASKAGMGVPTVNDTLVNVQTLQFADETITDSENTSGVYSLTYPTSSTITGTTVVTQSVVTNGVETSSTIGTGTITFDGGTLQAGANNLIFANAALINSTGGTFDLDGNTLTWDGAISNGSGSTAGGLTVTDSSSGAKGTLILGNTNTFTGSVAINGGASVELNHEDQNGVYLDSLGSGQITLNNGTLINGIAGSHLQNAIAVGAGGGIINVTNVMGFFGALTGSGHLTVTGNGWITMLNPDAGFSGVTLITGGAYIFGEPQNTLSSLSDYQVDSGSGLWLAQRGENVPNLPQTIGSLADGPNGGGTVMTKSDLVGTLTLGDNVNTTFHGLIQDHDNLDPQGVFALVKQGSDTFTEAGANTYSGGTTISAGVIAATNSTITNGAETSSSIGTGALTFDGGTLKAGTNNLVFANAALVNSTGGAFDVNGDTLTWDGAISNGSGSTAGGLTVTDSSSVAKGTLVLDSANTFTGGVVVTDGATLSVQHFVVGGGIDALGSGPLTLNGGQLLNGSGGNRPFNNAVVIGAEGGVINGGASITHGLAFHGALTGSGTLTLTGGDSYGFYHADAGFSGQTVITGDSYLFAEPNNTLSALSDYRLDSGSSLEISNETGAAAPITETIGSLANGAGGGGVLYNNTNLNATLTLGDTVNTSFSGIISDHGSSTHTGILSLVKQGSDTFTEAGANTYSGDTTLVAGVLDLNAATTTANNDGGTGAIVSGAAGKGAVAFSNGAQTLQIEHVALGTDANHSFAYAINGFGTDGDLIDVRGVSSSDTINYNGASGMLQLMNGSTVEASLHIGAGYGADVFTVTADTAIGGAADNIASNMGVHISVAAATPAPPPPVGGGGGGSTSGGGAGGGVTLTGGSTPAVLQGSDGNDTLTAGSSPDTLVGGAGDDHLIGGSGSAMLYGNAGNDVITLTSSTLNSVVYGGQGDDVIDASQSSHDNFLSGDLGNDTIILGSGADTAYGGAGDDSVTAGAGHDQIYGNAGNDIITLGASSGASTVFAGQGDDIIDASGSTQSNFISADIGNDMVKLGSGADTAYGGSGDDTVIAGSGHDQVYGNAGNDVIDVGASSPGVTVFAGQGNDIIDASGSTQGNFISADAGDDSILGGTGADTIHGGSGSDTIVAAANSNEQIHVGTADSSAMSATDQTQLDHILNFGSGDKLVFDGDPAATSANTTFHSGDASITNYATAYTYAFGSGTSTGVLSGGMEYAVVSDSQGHVYVFAADHAAVELDGLSGGVNGVAVGQILAA